MSLWDYEREQWNQGVQTVCGVDEAGRGPLCGPVVAAACILPLDCHIEGLDDSKKLTEKKRMVLAEQIRTLDKKRLREKTGHADDELLASISNALKISIGLCLIGTVCRRNTYVSSFHKKSPPGQMYAGRGPIMLRAVSSGAFPGRSR